MAKFNPAYLVPYITERYDDAIGWVYFLMDNGLNITGIKANSVLEKISKKLLRWLMSGLALLRLQVGKPCNMLQNNDMCFYNNLETGPAMA